MAFNRPTLIEINERVNSEIKGLLGVTNILRRSFLAVIGRVMSGISHLWHGHLDDNSRQFLPTTMDEDNLIAYGGIWGIPRKEAVAGIYQITVTGTDGTSIPVNTIWKKSNNFEFFVQSAGVISGGTALITIVATESGKTSEEGKDTLLGAGDSVSLLNPIAGIDSEATYSATSIEPEDIEDIEDYRARVIERIQNPISGGTATDYVQWAKEVAGVTRAWVLPQNLGPGTVGVTFVEDTEDPITPSPAKVQEVQDYIDFRRPVTANVTVFAPNLFPIDMEIRIKPNTTVVQNAVIEELKDLILRDAALNGAYKSGTETFDGKILLSRLNEVISLAVGEEDHIIDTINTAAPADVQPPTNNLAVLGTITWQPLA